MLSQKHWDAWDTHRLSLSETNTRFSKRLGHGDRRALAYSFFDQSLCQFA